MDLLDIGLEQRIEAQVNAKAGPIVRIRQKNVISVFNIHVPTHESHLQVQYGGIPSVIRQDELDCIAICDPSELLTKAHMAVFVNGPIASKSFPEMRVQLFLVAACTATSKCDRMKDSQ